MVFIQLEGILYPSMLYMSVYMTKAGGGGGGVSRRLKWYPCSSEHFKIGL